MTTASSGGDDDGYRQHLDGITGAGESGRPVARRPERSTLNIPIPDPSDLTTEALHREIYALRELLEVKLGANQDAIKGSKEIIETRLGGMDKAILLLQEGADRVPSWVDEKIIALKEVHETRFDALSATHTEKFSSIQTQFKERDTRAEQSGKDSKTAVDAALQAAKEAVGEQNKSNATSIAKSEATTSKQIEQLGNLITAMTKAAEDKIADVKERLTRIESIGIGLDKGERRRTDTSQFNVGLIGMVVGSLIGLAGLALAFLHHG
jgi:hypothetical protein